MISTAIAKRTHRKIYKPICEFSGGGNEVAAAIAQQRDVDSERNMEENQAVEASGDQDEGMVCVRDVEHTREEVRDAAELPYLLKPSEAAVLLRTTEKAIYKQIERGQLPGVTRRRRRILIFRDDLLRYLDEGRAPSSEVR